MILLFCFMKKMTTPLVQVLQDSRCLPDDDFLVLCLATNVDKNFLVIEALAGTGKTTLLLDVIHRLDCDKCIVFSFSRTAVKVIKVRLVRQTGQWLKTQTFDSLFLHLNHKKVQGTEPTFQTYRDMVVESTEEDLEQFRCRTRNLNYQFCNIEYVFVDEAQDSPPEAFEFLNMCRKAGKQVVITGDRHQAIFRFMNTASLFDSVPKCHSIRHQLVISRRCIQAICDHVNTRFGLQMRSSRTDPYDNTNPLEVSIQCRLNSTMGQMYVHLVTLLNMKVIVNLSDDEGDSESKFYNAAYMEIMQKYGVTLEKAKDIFDFLKERSARMRGYFIVLSTAHRYKGDESDLSILAYDLDIDSVSDDSAEENLKYVACTRPRYGLLHTLIPHYIGVIDPLERLGKLFQKRVINVGINGVTQVASSFPVILMRMMADPRLRRFIQLATECYREHQLEWKPESGVHMKEHLNNCTGTNCTNLVGSACDVAVTWKLEQEAFRCRVLHVSVGTEELAASIDNDRKLKVMLKKELVSGALVNTYRKLIIRAKIRAILCRYLVVRYNFPLDGPMIRRGVFASACLQSYHICKSVLVFRQTVSQCCISDYNLLVNKCFSNMPPFLRDGTQWQALSVHGSLPNTPLMLKGAYDAMICDRSSSIHLFEVKCVRALRFCHFLQTMIYTAMCLVNMGSPVHYTTLWSLRDNCIYQLPSTKVRLVAQELLNNFEAFNVAISCKTDPQFYPKEYNVSEIAF